MFRFLSLFLLSAVILASCQMGADAKSRPVARGQTGAPQVRIPQGATAVRLWATRYFLVDVDSVASGTGVRLRNMLGEVIGPEISRRDVCQASIESTVRVNDTHTYHYTGLAGHSVTNCRGGGTGRARWARVKHEFGLGVGRIPLVPFKSIACDMGRMKRSTRWVNGGYANPGDKIYIPLAVGVVLPNGATHDGYFTCHDVGPGVVGNHIDVFLGAVKGGEAAARALDPFPFIGDHSGETFEAYLIRGGA